jgi:DNA replication protein DnaC
MILTKEELKTKDLSRTCGKHGAYEAKVMEWLDQRCMIVDTCMKCTAETREAEEALEAEERRKREESNRRQWLINHGISPRYLNTSLSAITPTPEQEAVHKSLSAYLQSRLTSSLILAGTVGTGKTLLAQALAQDLMALGKDFIFSTARQVVRDIRSTWSRDSKRTEDEVIAMHVNADYLFIDEVGIQYGTESEQIAMFDIINGRYEYERPTILITNLDIVGLKEIMGERIIDRLRQDGGELLAFNWKSLRT